MSATVDELHVPAPADYHVHVRQGAMSALIAPHVSAGGFQLAYVMPNTLPPISSTEQALQYQADLQRIAPQTQWIMTLYLSPALTPEEIRQASKAGVRGVKSYPRGVTTNSDGGIEDYEAYYPVFEAMEQENMVLNLHGEVPSDADKGICVLNAEAAFLSHLHKLHARFPKLRIVLEHATTAAAVEAVQGCSETVACTITAHHLALTVDDWAGRPINFCKPVAKYPSDREALRRVIKEGHPRFFLGSDSAPHPFASKLPSATTHGSVPAAAQSACAAGVYTSAILLPLCATLLESFGALDKLNGFVSTNGRRFYGDALGKNTAAPGETQPAKDVVVLRRVKSEGEEGKVPGAYVLEGHQDMQDSDKEKVSVVPFWAGKQLGWAIV
ncbi:putative dihydroorotase [Tilletiaria anomala UBC 951]|uniref:dihydroorotase n=1 Tax=Tilletiaria anomala (strain ATCC 24038 / CBS 436.72 / UBC 951) TaxID=1037660 RepID=A0A066W5V9_TILAU|nr:putative dihydroorotase [Tilletiaria anomala UBC 951]KDN46459.1 putative dihydroorotase [Tilletiaria anomala UBC 951]